MSRIVNALSQGPVIATVALFAAWALASLVPAAPASGAQRYASPTGDASDTTCPQADPCDLNTAVEHSGLLLAGEEPAMT